MKYSGHKSVNGVPILEGFFCAVVFSDNPGVAVHTGDDGFSEAVLGAMRNVAEPGQEKNRFYGQVYKALVEMYWGSE